MKFTICGIIFERGSFGRFARVNGRPVSDSAFTEMVQAAFSNL